MFGTLQALLVAAIALLPGAAYTIARESRGATWAWRQTDAATLVFRFLTASAVFHAALAPVSYRAYEHLLVTHKLSQGQTVSWRWWPVLVGYVVIPYAVGAITENARSWQEDAPWFKRAISRIAAIYAGRSPEPRAWDRFFGRRPYGIVRLQLTNDEWKAGLWSDRSFASQYGEDGDLFLADEYVVDENGVIRVEGDSTDGDYQEAGVGVLIRWSEVRYLEFAEWPADNIEQDGSNHDG
jgi:hypothetical protein